MSASDDSDDDGFELAAIELAASRPSAKPAFVTVEREPESNATVSTLAAAGVAIGAAFAVGPVSFAAPDSNAPKAGDAEAAPRSEAEEAAPNLSGPSAVGVSSQPAFVTLDEAEPAVVAAPVRGEAPAVVAPLEVNDTENAFGQAQISPAAPQPAAVAAPAALPASTAVAPLSLAALNQLFATQGAAIPAPADSDASEGFAMAERLAGRFGVKMEALRASLEDRLDAFAFSDVAQEAPAEDAPLDPFMDAVDPIWLAHLVESGELAGLMSEADLSILLSDIDLPTLSPSLHDSPDGFVV